MAEDKAGGTRARSSRARSRAAEDTAAQATDTGPDTDLDMEAETPDLPVEPRTRQFPSLEGTDEARDREIAQRSPDGSVPGRFVKTIRVGRLAPADDDPIHTSNAVGVVQEAMQRGLHPRGDVYLTRVVEHDWPLNDRGTRRSQHTDLTYEVDVVPAAVDTHPTDTTSPKVIHQARAGGDGHDAAGDDADHVGDGG